MPTSQLDTLRQQPSVQSSLYEEPRKSPIVVGVVCTLLFHILLVLLAPLLPVDKLSGTHSSLAAIEAAKKKEKTFDFELEKLLPPTPEKQSDLTKFVDTNPDAPANEPDKTANFSNNTQQAAQAEAAKEKDPEHRPSVQGQSLIESTAIVSGDNTAPQRQVLATTESTQQQDEQHARANLTPIAGFEKSVAETKEGIASTEFKEQPQANNIDQLIDGSKTGTNFEGGLVEAKQTSKPKPKPRPRLSQVMNNYLQTKLTGVINAGVTANDAFKTEYGDYLEEFQSVIMAHYYAIIEDRHYEMRPGTYVHVLLKLNSRGEVTILRIEDTAGEPLKLAFLAAIQNAQPFRLWTPKMIESLGNEQETQIGIRVPYPEDYR